MEYANAERLRCVVERITYQNDTNGYILQALLTSHKNGLLFITKAIFPKAVFLLRKLEQVAVYY